MTEEKSLISEQRVDNHFVMIFLLNFHLSFDKVLKEVWPCIQCQPSLGRILQTDFPEDVAILVPATLHTSPFSEEWFCITKENSVSHRISRVDKGSLVNVIPSDKKAVILISHPYAEAVELSK